MLSGLQITGEVLRDLISASSIYRISSMEDLGDGKISLSMVHHVPDLRDGNPSGTPKLRDFHMEIEVFQEQLPVLLAAISDSVEDIAKGNIQSSRQTAHIVKRSIVDSIPADTGRKGKFNPKGKDFLPIKVQGGKNGAARLMAVETLQPGQTVRLTDENGDQFDGVVTKRTKRQGIPYVNLDFGGESRGYNTLELREYRAVLVDDANGQEFAGEDE